MKVTLTLVVTGAVTLNTGKTIATLPCRDLDLRSNVSLKFFTNKWDANDILGFGKNDIIKAKIFVNEYNGFINANVLDGELPEVIGQEEGGAKGCGWDSVPIRTAKSNTGDSSKPTNNDNGDIHSNIFDQED